MEPTYYAGDTVLGSSWFGTLKKNDVIVFVDEQTDRYFIKRIQKIVQDELYVRGDNKAESVDSRHFGTIKLPQIIGKVIAKL